MEKTMNFDDALHAAGGVYCRECESCNSGGRTPFFGLYCGEFGGAVGENDFCSRGKPKT